MIRFIRYHHNSRSATQGIDVKAFHTPPASPTAEPGRSPASFPKTSIVLQFVVLPPNAEFKFGGYVCPAVFV